MTIRRVSLALSCGAAALLVWLGLLIYIIAVFLVARFPLVQPPRVTP